MEKGAATASWRAELCSAQHRHLVPLHSNMLPHPPPAFPLHPTHRASADIDGDLRAAVVGLGPKLKGTRALKAALGVAHCAGGGSSGRRRFSGWMSGPRGRLLINSPAAQPSTLNVSLTRQGAPSVDVCTHHVAAVGAKAAGLPVDLGAVAGVPPPVLRCSGGGEQEAGG